MKKKRATASVLFALLELRSLSLLFTHLTFLFSSLFPEKGPLIGRYDGKHSETRSRDYIVAHETLQFCRPFSCRGTT